MAKKKQKWELGDLFTLPLKDGTFCMGQVLNIQMKNVVCCALFDIKLTKDDIDNVAFEFTKGDIISVVATSKEQIDFGVWKVVGNQLCLVPIEEQPNEEFRSKGWVGAKISDASIIEEFCDAFYALVPWDDWGDPNYLDKFLISPLKKPNNLLFK
jgi:hypothetical protein